LTDFYYLLYHVVRFACMVIFVGLGVANGTWAVEGEEAVS